MYIIVYYSVTTYGLYEKTLTNCTELYITELCDESEMAAVLNLQRTLAAKIATVGVANPQS